MQRLVRLIMSSPRPLVTRGTSSEKKRVVAVLGWAGGSEKNVAKYSELYNRHGYTTVQFTSSPLSIGWGVKNARDVNTLAESLRNELSNDNRLLFHCFSMNGFLTLCALDLQFPDLRVFERCDGLFLDSCPIRFTGFRLRNSTQYSLVMDHVYASMNPSKNMILAFLYGILKTVLIAQFALRAMLENTLVRIGAIRCETISSWHYTLNHASLPPVVSLVYSDADAVCSARYICEWHEKLERREDADKREIMVNRHVDSLHVEHFRKYPDQYKRQVEEFLKKVERLNRSKI